MKRSVVMASSFKATRSSFKRPDHHAPSHPTKGELLQINTIDQFSDWSRPSIVEFNGPSAVCGYCSCANAVVLSRLLSQTDRRKPVSRVQFDSLVAALRDEQKVLVEMRRAMKFTYEARQAWIAKQPEAAFAKNSRDSCLKVWAANHELSDYMRSLGPNAGNVHFLRYNQWPERDAGQWEEAERLVEEQPFGGQTLGCKASVALEPGASRFILERFVPTRVLQTPENWLREETKREQSGARLPPSIFLLDLNGHFTVGVGLLLESSSGEEVVPTFIMFNTMSENALSEGAPAAAFDFCFPPTTSSSSSSTTSSSSTSSVVTTTNATSSLPPATTASSSSASKVSPSSSLVDSSSAGSSNRQ